MTATITIQPFYGPEKQAEGSRINIIIIVHQVKVRLLAWMETSFVSLGKVNSSSNKLIHFIEQQRITEVTFVCTDIILTEAAMVYCNSKQIDTLDQAT